VAMRISFWIIGSSSQNTSVVTPTPRWVQLATHPGAELREFELQHSVSTEDQTTLRYLEVPDFPIPRGITGGSYEQVPGMSLRRTLAAQLPPASP
jgi:hypothetical protein